MSDALKEVSIYEVHDCEEVHPDMSHRQWKAQEKDAKEQDMAPVGKQHEQFATTLNEAKKKKTVLDAAALQKKDHARDEKYDPSTHTSVGTKHKIKPQYNTKTHKLITTPSGGVKVVPKSTPGMEAEEVEMNEDEMMQLKHKKSGQIMRVSNKLYKKQAHIHRKRGWVPDSKQPHMRGGSAIQHSYEPEGDENLNELKITPKGERTLKKGDHKLSITPKGRKALYKANVAYDTAKQASKMKYMKKAEELEVEMNEDIPTKKFVPLKHKVWSADASIPAGARPKNSGKIKKYKASGAMPEEVENEVYKPNYGRRPWDLKQAKNKPTDDVTGPHNFPVNGDKKKKPAPPKKEEVDWKDMSDQQKKEKAKAQFDAILKKKQGNPKDYESPIKTKEEVEMQEAEFKVKIKSLPAFYVPAKSAAEVKNSLRRQIKRPDDIESIERVTKGNVKKDYRARAKG